MRSSVNAHRRQHRSARRVSERGKKARAPGGFGDGLPISCVLGQPPHSLSVDGSVRGPSGLAGWCVIVLSTACLLRPLAAPDPAWDEVACLVRRAQRGDRAAFGTLAEQFQNTVYSVCLRRLGNPSEALELTQEVFLHVMKRIGQLREPERFAGWIRQVAARMAINRATRRISPTCVEAEILEGSSFGEPTDGPLDSLIARERAQKLWESLNRLRAIDREALVSFYINGQSLNEIAERLDAPLGTIKRRLHTARRRLREDLMESANDRHEWTDGAESECDSELAAVFA